jgi:sulfur carrier protein
VTVTVNGEPRELADGATVQDVAQALELPADGRGVAIAVDREVVPRGAWGATPLTDGARIEVVRAVQGG